MRPAAIAASLILAFAGLSLASPAVAQQAQDEITLGQTYTIESEILGETRTVNVWIPPTGETDDRAPYRVLYLIDGGVKQDWHHMTGLATLGFVSGTFKPMIVVGIETGDRLKELTPAAADTRYTDQFPTSGHAAEFRAFITEEVKPFVEANFPVSGESTVIGESLAGLFIADTFLKAPEAFDDYVSVSPSLWWDDKALGAQAADLLEQGDYDGKRLYLANGNEDGTMRTAIDMFREAVAEAGLNMTYDDMAATETHSTVYHQAALNAFRHYYAEPPFHYGERPWYLTEGASPADAEGE